VPTVSAAAADSGKTNNFLIPNGTFIVELITFLLILAVLGKFVLPFVNKALVQRQEAIRLQFQEADEARARLEAAELEYRDQLAGARADAARQRQEAHEQGARILADSKAKAEAESQRMIAAAHQHIEAERTRTVAALRAEVGVLAVELAGRVVGESLTDNARQHRVVEAFLAEVEARSGEAVGSAVAGEQGRG
jgi:F-type H+-transporting ATPase subunit b